MYAHAEYDNDLIYDDEYYERQEARRIEAERLRRVNHRIRHPDPRDPEYDAVPEPWDDWDGV